MNEPAWDIHPDDPMEAAAAWCMRLSDGDMSEAEWTAFEAWHAQPGNGDRLRRMTAVWLSCDAIGDAPEIIPLRTEALTSYRNANLGRWGGAGRWGRWRGGAIAATLALVLTGGLLLLGGKGEAYETGVGERRIAALEDGSRVSLDAATALEVKIEDDRRTVEMLHGRAKFDVAKDTLRPFTVQAGDKLIVALGTSFSVEIVDGEVRVILYEGRVEVRDRTDVAASGVRDHGVRQVLTPGVELVDAIGSAAPGRLGTIDAGETLTWESGLLSFVGEPLGKAVERMNRYSSRTIRLADPSLATIPVDGEFEAGNAEAFVEGVGQVHGLKVTGTADEIVLRR